MKTALLAAALVAVSASLADAEKYVLRNGRASGGGSGGGRSAGAAPRSSGAPARQAGGGAGAEVVYGSPVDGGMAVAAPRSSGGHRSFWGRGAQLGRNVYRVPQRATEGGSGDGGSAPEETPPHFSKPGALIRTEGHRPFQYSEAGNHREHAVPAGAVALDAGKGHALTGAGLRYGPPDKLPPCTPGSSGCSGGGNAITPNSGGTTIVNNETHNGAHDNQNGNAGGNGKGNGNPFGGGTGFDPSF